MSEKAYTNVTADDWVMAEPTDPADVLALRDALSDLLDYTTGYINNKPTVCGQRYLDAARETLVATEQRARGQGSGVCGFDYGDNTNGGLCGKGPNAKPHRKGVMLGHPFQPATPPTPALTAARLALWEPFRKVIRDYTYQPFGQAEAQEMCARLIALATPPAPAAEVEG